MPIIIWMGIAVASALGIVAVVSWRWRRKTNPGPLERIKAVLEVVALAVAAPLAIVTFLSLEQWTLKPQAEISSHLQSRYQRSSGQCLTEFVVTVKNPGRARLTVERVKTALVAVPTVRRSNTTQRLRFDTVGLGALRTDAGLLFKYPPGVQYTDAFLWTHPPRPDTLLLARVHLYSKRDSVDYHYNWTDSCSPNDTLRDGGGDS